MSTAEFIDWMAYFRIEQEDMKRERERLEDQQRAQQSLRSMSGMR
jgi:hypothetical protein